MRIMTEVEDLMQRIRNGQTQVGYSVDRRSGDRVTPNAICIVHIEMSSTGFLIVT
jgi:hypothetical protein